jgi:hypothetical protein
MRDKIRYYAVKSLLVGFTGLSILWLFRPQESAVTPQQAPPPKPEVQQVSVADTLSRGETLYASLVSKGGQDLQAAGRPGRTAQSAVLRHR